MSNGPPTSARAGRIVRAVVIGGLLLAIGYLAWRGVWRALADSQDLAVGYAAARAWLAGHDPYAVAALRADLLAAGGAELASGDTLERLRNVYLPTTLPVFVPLALVPWAAAVPLMLALNVAAAVVIALGLVRLLGWPASSTRALGLMAVVLALAPLHTTLAIGQTGAIATAGIVAAMLAERSGRGTAAGLLYGLAVAVKVQIGLPFVAYLVWRRRWASAFPAIVLLAGLSLLSVGRLELAGVPWADSWLANVAALSGPGGINDPGPQNTERYSLINLQYLLFSVVPSLAWADLLSYLLVGGAALALVALIRGRQPHEELLALSIVAVLTLLVTYHRYYDAVLLAVPIAWAASALGTAAWRPALAVLVLSLNFVVPIQTGLHDLQERGLLPSWLTDGPVWGSVLIVQHVWALVLLALALLWAAGRSDEARTSGERYAPGGER